MTIDRRLCIVGLGLIGGSLAQALRNSFPLVVGVDRHAATRQQALQDRVVDVATDDLVEGIARTDMLVLATPVRTILRILHDLPRLIPEGRLVLDTGSTKLAINEAMGNLPRPFAALGGHPMCGKETAGYQAADAALFQGKPFILTRNRRTTDEIEALALSMIEALGAEPLFLTAEEHDRLAAAVSHLPYLVSATLMRTVSGVDGEQLWRISASGLRDSTRLAGSDPRMLADILLTNREAVLHHLQAYRREMDLITTLLLSGDEKSLADWLGEAQREYAAYRRHRDGNGR